MGAFIDLTGKRFGRLMVLNIGQRVKNDHFWFCRCDCSIEKFVRGHSLRGGGTISCGCHAREQIGKIAITHGLRYTRIYNIYQGILARCYNPKKKGYQYYGGRGIAVCDEWKNNFIAFYHWAMANGYSDELSIDRKDTNGNYCPENCRWATQLTQVRNRRNNRRYTYNDLTLCISEWAERTGINKATLFYRLNKGWNMEKALSKKAHYKTPMRPPKGEGGISPSVTR